MVFLIGLALKAILELKRTNFSYLKSDSFEHIFSAAFVKL